MREVKSLYLGRRYKQCAAVATDVLRKFSGQVCDFAPLVFCR